MAGLEYVQLVCPSVQTADPRELQLSLICVAFQYVVTSALSRVTSDKFDGPWVTFTAGSKRAQ